MRLTLALAMLLAACAPATRAPSSAAVTGSVSYVQRIALPPDAVLTVRLLDVSRADAPSVTLAEQTIPLAGRQVPVPFSLAYDAADVDPRLTYAVRAEILHGGDLLWTTGTVHRVLTQGAPSSGIDIRLAMVGGSAGVPSAPLVGSAWRLVRIALADGGEVRPGAGETHSLEVMPQGRVGGLAHCNRFSGSYTLAGSDTITFGDAVTTLMACPEPSTADAYLDALGAATRFEHAGDALRLHTGDGRTLHFEPAP